MPGRNARIFMTAGMLSLLLIYVQGSPIIRTINPLWLAFFCVGGGRAGCYVGKAAVSPRRSTFRGISGQ